MNYRLWTASRKLGFVLVLAMWGSRAVSVSAQGIVAVNATAEEVPPATPTQSPGPLSLDACLELGFQHQPSLDAARASLSAAQAGRQGLQRMILPRIIVPDYKIRMQQSCYGVTIAEAGVTQAEWETRYAITRNFLTVQYIRSQGTVVNEVLKNLDTGYKRAEKLYRSGDADVKITAIDLDAIKVQIAIVKGKKAQVDNGMHKAFAALREAMGLKYDYPLEIAAVDLPSPVVEVKKMVDEVVEEKDKNGKTTKKTVKVEVVEYKPIRKLDKSELIAGAIANRGEIVQANAANRVTELEIQAQMKIFGWKGNTFAQGADTHVQLVPQGEANGKYRPAAIGIEMPPMIAGRKRDREARASALNDRAAAVVDKANSLVALDVEAQYLNWHEAVEDVESLKSIEKIAQGLPDRVQKLQPKDFTSSAVIQANITAIMVRTELNDAMHMHALALAGLERATAGAFRVQTVLAK